VFGNDEIKFKIGDFDLEFNIGHQYKCLNTGHRKTGEIFSGVPDESVKIEEY
jgi:hypothetical protein